MKDNSKKKKSIRTILSKILTALVFVSGLTFMGVAFALQSVKVNMSGQVNFNAKSVYCDITGAISGMSTNPSLEDIHIEDSEDSASQLTPTTWKDLTLQFANETTPIVITITVHNLSEERALYVDIEDTFASITNLGVAKLVGTETSNFSMIEVGAEETKTFKVSLSIKNTSKSIAGNFSLVINLNSPTTINSLSEIDTSTTEFRCYQLANDIDLTSLGTTSSRSLGSISGFTKVDDECYAILPTFNGIIDGAGHTIIMNSVGSNGYAYLFGSLSGKIKNIVLEYNADGVKSALAYISEGDLVLEDVTANGDINLVDKAEGFSPLVQKAKGTSISFINCTNNVDIIATAGYGSAFLGNRVYGTKANVVGKTYTDYSAENANANYTSSHIVVDNVVTFKGCVNTGTIMMESPALLYGNVWDLPDKDNIIIENCVNNGRILGGATAGYISQMRAGELNNSGSNTNTDREFWHRGQYLTDLEAYASRNITGTGTKTVASLSGLTLSKDSDKNIIVSNTNSGSYEYEIVVTASYDILNSNQIVQTFTANAVFTVSSKNLTSGGNTGVKYLSVGYISGNNQVKVDGKTYSYTNLTTVSSSNMALTGIATALKIATLQDGRQIYVFDISTSETVTFKGLSNPISIITYEVTSSGKELKDFKKVIA